MLQLRRFGARIWTKRAATNRSNYAADWRIISCMALLLTFIPWLLFWVLLCLHRLEAAGLAGLIATLLFIIWDISHNRALKILQTGTLVFFFLLALAVPVIGPRVVGQWADLLGSAALALIVLTSILIGKPFTLQYARETAPRERWDRPEFIRKNFVISWVWFGAFLFNLSVPVARRLSFSVPIILNWVLSICAFAVAMKFTHWYAGRGNTQPVSHPQGVSAPRRQQ